MRGLCCAGQEQDQSRGGGGGRAGGDQEADAKDPAQAGLQRSGEIAHEPKYHAAEIVSGEGGEQEHDDGGEKGRADNAGEEQSSAIDLPFAATEEIYGRYGCGGAEERAQRSEERGEPDWQREVRLRDESEDGSEGGTHGNAENVGIGEWVAKQGLVAGSGHGERRADDNGEENARPANLHDDHAVITGESLGLVKQDANQISAEAVNGHR